MGLTHVGYMQAYFMNVLELNSVLCYAQRCCGLLLGCASNRVCITPVVLHVHTAYHWWSLTLAKAKFTTEDV